VPTFAEVIALARRAGRGVYPELKHPTYFASIGLPMEDALLGALAEAGWTQKSDPVFVQCFEVGPLERLRTRTQLRLVQLIADEGGPVDRPGRSYRDMITPAGLPRWRAMPTGSARPRASSCRAARRALALAHHIGGRRAPGGPGGAPVDLPQRELLLPAELRRGADPREHGDAAAEMRMFISLGVDGYSVTTLRMPWQPASPTKPVCFQRIREL
jgi:glycerophosphoryl diester phosphodiesterase